MGESYEKVLDVKKWVDYILRIIKGNSEEKVENRRHSQATD